MRRDQGGDCGDEEVDGKIGGHGHRSEVHLERLCSGSPGDEEGQCWHEARFIGSLD